jgi:uncharacterized Zn finger protein
MMQPISIEQKNGEFVITHKCEKCGKVMKQQTSPDDGMDTIIAISSNPDFIFGK